MIQLYDVKNLKVTKFVNIEPGDMFYDSDLWLFTSTWVFRSLICDISTHYNFVGIIFTDNLLSNSRKIYKKAQFCWPKWLQIILNVVFTLKMFHIACFYPRFYILIWYLCLMLLFIYFLGNDCKVVFLIWFNVYLM